MVPGKYNITIYRGSTWSISLSAQNQLEVDTNFEEIYSEIRLHIRPAWVKKAASNTNPLFILSTTNGRITFQDDGVTMVLTISAADTEKLAFDAGQYDLELVTADDPPVVDKLLYGSVTVIGEMTR